MRSFIAAAILICACEAGKKPDPVEPAGTGGQITVSGTYGSADSSSSSSGADTSSSSDTSSSTSESSSSTTGPECLNDGDPCEGGGICVVVDSGLACSHGNPGDPCILPGDCVSENCYAQPEDVDAAGICTGPDCDIAMTECGVGNTGTCIMIDEKTLLCSQGNVGEPCITDADCIDERCQEYAVDGGTVLVCAP
ncbi:MAG TPA: hypothetical protein VG755_37255 [Nannocystaceae bacterium]|nr:hypothetical protein [Nannocystaceae bacterium]